MGEPQRYKAEMQQRVAQQYAGLGGEPAVAVRETTMSTLANELADAIVDLRAGITNLYSELSGVCMPPQINDAAAQKQPMHPLSSLGQLQGLIEQVRGAERDVRDMISGLRV
jgi:hypothetical protein